jgi:hypothetical protein
MSGERLEVRARHRLERARELPVALPEPGRREGRHDRLADPIVRRLDDLVSVAEARAHEPLRAKLADERIQRAPRVARVSHNRHRERAPAHRDHLDEPPRVDREPLEAPADDLLERKRRRRDSRVVRRSRAAARPHSARELLDEERASARFSRDRVGHLHGSGVVGAEQGEGETPRLVGGERPDRMLAHVGAGGPEGGGLEQEGVRLRVLVAVRHHEQKRRCLGRSHQLEEQRRAVAVAPLHVVDEDDERVAPRDLREQITERDEGSLPQHLRIGDRLLGDDGDPGDTPEDGEEARERPDVARHDDGHALIVEALHVAAECIDHGVDGLVRNGLALVSAPPQHLGLDVLLELVDEMVNERRLA